MYKILVNPHGDVYSGGKRSNFDFLVVNQGAVGKARGYTYLPELFWGGEVGRLPSMYLVFFGTCSSDAWVVLWKKGTVSTGPSQG